MCGFSLLIRGPDCDVFFVMGTLLQPLPCPSTTRRERGRCLQQGSVVAATERVGEGGSPKGVVGKGGTGDERQV